MIILLSNTVFIFFKQMGSKVHGLTNVLKTKKKKKREEPNQNLLKVDQMK